MTGLRISIDGPCAGDINMRRDADRLATQKPDDPPFLRLYRWSPPAISIGYNQREEDFDAAAVAARGWKLVRRPTGGRAILHADELTYCVVGSASSTLFGDTLHTSYDRINRALLRFLGHLGIEADVSEGEGREAARSPSCFTSAGRYEIRVGGRKLIGSAQRRTGGVFMQHGSILTGAGHARLGECLGAGVDAAAFEAGLRAATTDLGQLGGETLEEEDLAEMTGQLAAAFAAEFTL